MKSEKLYEEWNATLLEHINSISIPNNEPMNKISKIQVQLQDSIEQGESVNEL